MSEYLGSLLMRISSACYPGIDLRNFSPEQSSLLVMQVGRELRTLQDNRGQVLPAYPYAELIMEYLSYPPFSEILEIEKALSLSGSGASSITKRSQQHELVESLFYALPPDKQGQLLSSYDVEA